jgi:hypothetical protein
VKCFHKACWCIVFLCLLSFARYGISASARPNAYDLGDKSLYPQPQPVTSVKRATNLQPDPSLASIIAQAPLVLVSSQAVQLELLAQIHTDKIAGVSVPSGMQAVVLVTRWTNVVAKAKVTAEQLAGKSDRSNGVGGLLNGSAESAPLMEKDVAYKVPTPDRHLFLAVDGVAVPMASESATLPQAMPLNEDFVIARHGQSREARLAFIVPQGSKNLALNFIDNVNGNLLLEVSGNATLAQSGAPKVIQQGELDGITLATEHFNWQQEYGGIKAPTGWQFVLLDLLGHGQGGKKSAIAQLEPAKVMWLSTDNGGVYYALPQANGSRGIHFTPGVFQRRQVAFMLPSSTRQFNLGVRGKENILTLAVTGQVPEMLPDSANAQTDGNALSLSVLGLRWENQHLVMEFQARNLNKSQGIELDIKQQLLLLAGSATTTADMAMTARLSRRPPLPLIIPPATSIRFDVAYTADNASPATSVHYRGFNADLDFDLTGLSIQGSRGQSTADGITDFPDFSVWQRQTKADKPLSAVPPKTIPLGMTSIVLPALDKTSAVQEKEPNNQVKEAQDLGPDHAVHGSLGRGDIDIYYLDVAGEPQRWLMDVEGEGVGGEITYIDTSGYPVIQRRPLPGAKSIWIENLFLMPGRHWFSISAAAQDGDYLLRLVPLGKIDKGDEYEPNDDVSRAHPLQAGTPRHGVIGYEDDKDRYMFALETPAHVRIKLVPPADLQLDLQIEGNGSALNLTGNKLGGPGKVVEYEAMLNAGDYKLLVSSGRRGKSQHPYELSLELLDPFVLPADREPNNSAGTAGPLSFGQNVKGRVGEFSYIDWYRLPQVSQPTKLQLQLSSEQRKVVANLYRVVGQNIQSDYFQVDISKRSADSDSLSAELQPEQQYALSLSGQGDYQLQLDVDAPLNQPVVRSPTDLSIKLKGAVPLFSAYQSGTQKAELNVQLSATSDVQNVHLAAEVNQAGWQLELPAEFSLKAGETKNVAVNLIAAPDRPDGQPANLFMRLADDQGQGQSLTIPLQASCMAPMQTAGSASMVPQALRGGINIALKKAGASTTPTDSMLAQLFDGQVAAGAEWQVAGGQLPFNLDIQLAGSPVPVVGLAIVPQVGFGNQDQLGPFEVQVSDDGQNYVAVYQGRLMATPIEQYFVFDHPAIGRYMRIQLQAADIASVAGRLSLAEIKVIAAPGSQPFGDMGINLADPDWGGHIVRAQPQADYYKNLESMLTAQQDGSALYYRKGDVVPIEWVVGFKHNRAAQIHRLEWLEQAKESIVGFSRIGQVEVSVSLDSPLGPWRSLGEWTLPDQPDGQVSLALDNPQWARFVRFRRAGQSNDSNAWLLPETLRILEQPVDETYRSAVGEWGLYSQSAIYEQQLRNQFTANNGKDLAGETLEQAYSLHAGKTVNDSVSIGLDQDLYRLDVPAEMNQLSLDFDGSGASRLDVSLMDAKGKLVSLRQTLLNDGTRRFVADVQGGQRYYAKVAEPPRSIMIVWDNSGSVVQYHPTMYRALQHFFDEVQAGQEWVDLMPMQSHEAKTLLPDWSDDPQTLKQALSRYNRADGSSNAENALNQAVLKLSKRPGNRAIVLLTDAVSDGFSQSSELWTNLAKVRPAIFPLELHLQSNEISHSQDLMQDWAAVNHGRYTAFRTLSDLDRSFSRAACLMRRPVEYSLNASFAHISPGSLEVKWQEGSALAGAAVELIIDASGSMRSSNAKIDGRLKIDLAKEAMLKVVADLPAELDVGLRVYGQRIKEGQPGDCQDSELVNPIGPLNRDELGMQISNINALGTTPIGYSLQQAGQDLAKVAGRKLIVLVTDGEEECKTDPVQAITDLRAKGLDVRLDIAGFALPDEKTRLQMQQAAKAGGGQFFDTDNGEALSKAIDQALASPFDVIDINDQVVASGLVGKAPLSLSPGQYKIVAHTARGDISGSASIEANGKHVLVLIATVENH